MTRIRRHLIGAIGALALVAGMLVVSPPPAEGHPVTQQTVDICLWMKNYAFGDYSPGIALYGYGEVHWWGSHQVICYYDPKPPSGAANWTILYDRISGAWAWI